MPAPLTASDRLARTPPAEPGGHIEINEEILGGTPVIRGTRITVYAIDGRLSGGDTVEEIVGDYAPMLSREAVEAAALYARNHPLAGRLGGRPWRRSE